MTEGPLAADRLARAVGADAAQVDAARGAVEVVGERAEIGAQERDVLACEVGASLDRAIFSAPRGPTPWKRRTGSTATNRAPSPGRITQSPSGLFWSLASLARNLL